MTKIRKIEIQSLPETKHLKVVDALFDQVLEKAIDQFLLR